LHPRAAQRKYLYGRGLLYVIPRSETIEDYAKDKVFKAMLLTKLLLSDAIHVRLGNAAPSRKYTDIAMTCMCCQLVTQMLHQES